MRETLEEPASDSPPSLVVVAVAVDESFELAIWSGFVVVLP